MALPEQLKPYEAYPGIRSFAKVFRKIEKELGKLGVAPSKVEVLATKDTRSALRRLFSYERADAADHWLIVQAEARATRPVRIVAPFRRGLTLPYSLEIGLRTKLGYTGTLRRNMLRKPRWEMLPATAESRDLGTQLDQLDLPSVAWRHDSGGIPILLKEVGRIGPTQTATPAATHWPSSWTVISGYQGFIVNVGPRIVKYVEVVSRLEEFLALWKPRPVPEARRPESGERPSAAPVEKQASADPAEPELELPDQATIDALRGSGDETLKRSGS